MKQNPISHNAVVATTLKTVNYKLIRDLSDQLAVTPEDEKLHNIIKLELELDNLWYKISDNGLLKVGMFIFSDKPTPAKFTSAINKCIDSYVVNFLMFVQSKAGSNITKTHDFINAMLRQMNNYTDPKKQHAGGFIVTDDFEIIEALLKELKQI